MCKVYEVLSSNHLKLIYGESFSETTIFLLIGEKGTNPNVLIINLETKEIGQIDLLEQSAIQACVEITES